MHDPAIDEVTATAPADPAYREGVSIWVWDDDGRWHLPRVGVEAVGARWATSFETAVCIARPGEDLLLAFDDDPPMPVADADGRPRVLGAGGLRFECVEPFEHWRVTFEGDAIELEPAAYLAGGEAKPRADGQSPVPVRFAIDAQMVAPPWFQGTHDPIGVQVAGERRHEQLGRVELAIEVGDERASVRGGCLRVHRKGGDRNDYGEFHGHCWQTASFANGDAFGCIRYRPGPEGAERYSEAWVQVGGEVHSARAVRTPWMEAVQHRDEELTLVLRSPIGEHVIAGTTVAGAHRPPRGAFPQLHSAIARYRWDGQEAYGMVERSARL